jgi:hypothetical protein
MKHREMMWCCSGPCEKVLELNKGDRNTFSHALFPRAVNHTVYSYGRTPYSKYTTSGHTIS